MDKILVAYATKYGSTEKMAEAIGDVLSQAGLPADVVPVDRVRDLTPYRAVILGSAVYIGKWRKEAVQFLKKNQQGLAERPVWLFSSGPTGEGDPVELLKGWRFPEGLQQTADRIRPRDTAVFGGVLDPKKLNAIERFVLKRMKAAMGDFRDWTAIEAWAGKIASELAAES